MSNASTAVQQKKRSGFLGRFLRRLLLCLVTFTILTVGALGLMLNLVFNGPSPTARDNLTATLSRSSLTSWAPQLFLGEDWDGSAK